jgi:hypothetical protein
MKNAILVRWRNPCPLGTVRKVVSLEKESAHGFSLGRCPHNETKGKNYEQIQANVAHGLALRISHCLDAKVAVWGAAREGQRGGGVKHSGTEPAIGLRGGGVERGGGPRACIGADTAQDFDFRIHGAGEREGGLAGVERLPRIAVQAVLGESLLDQGIRCGHGGVGPSNDTEVSKMAGERGTETRRVPV